MSTSIDSLVKEYTKIKEEFTENAKNAVRVTFKEFFEANPEIDQIAWTQYTPYFNDGDECVFSVHEKGFTLAKDNVNLEDIGYPEDEDGFYGGSFWGDVTDPVKEYRTAFNKFDVQISKLPDEIFLNTFGNHVKVIASKKGFDVEEYEHD